MRVPGPFDGVPMARPAFVLLAVLIYAGAPCAVAQQRAAAALPPSLAPMLARAAPGVVNIAVEGTITTRRSASAGEGSQDIFGAAPDAVSQQRFRAVGSGVIVDAANGYVITNNHLISRADKLAVTLTDRRRLPARLVGADRSTDLAVLQLPAGGLSAVPVGDSSSVLVGDYVVALGSPFGLGQTATFGIVSALRPSRLGGEDVIQTDAAINPGNSGGALIDLEGRLIGINTAIVTAGGQGNVGVGFAIPINTAMRIVRQLIARGKVDRIELGLATQDLTPQIAAAMKLHVSSGALVVRVFAHSAAFRAGVRAGDVIIALNGTPVRDSAGLGSLMEPIASGQPLQLSLQRGSEQLSVSVPTEAPAGVASVNAPASSSLAGASFSAIPREHPLYGTGSGVYVESVDPGSPASGAGLHPDDIILRADQTAIVSPSQLSRLVSNRRAGVVVLIIQRGEDSLLLPIR
jgi:Do/DeqQ family serine protease